jgi:Ca-activated chloride channel family protein
MRASIICLAIMLSGTGLASAAGLLIPDDRSVPPLAMVRHDVSIAIEDQVAVTHIEQIFRNHTSRPLEATYIFPVPKNASVKRFSMWVNGKETPGELIPAERARQIYTDIVRRTLDPSLLEWMDTNLLKLRIFPVPPHGDQRIGLSYTSVAAADAGVVSYTYPVRAAGKSAVTSENVSLRAVIKSQRPVQNVYSPTHAIAVTRSSDHEVQVALEEGQGGLDRDFQLYYGLGDQAIGLTALVQRPVSSEPGFFLMLMSPRIDSGMAAVPRDIVLVLDTSGSMRGAKMDQARRALQYCLSHLNAADRFGLISFATTVSRYRDQLVPASREQLEDARRWVEQLEATGGTAIDDALGSALALGQGDKSRGLTIVFFTDGAPTIGETDPQKILRNVTIKNASSTRIFTFGVGDDVNAMLLDQLAEQTRALSTYVRPAENIEAKVSSLYSKMSHPVMTDLHLSMGDNVRLIDMYPPQLPDLFSGAELMVLGRYTGQGPAALRLTGTVVGEPREFVYETTFPERTTQDKSFVEHVWARRKVGYLLDQIRANGEKKELIDEVMALAKKYAIATPYTSYLIVPDAMPVASASPWQDGTSFRWLSKGSAEPAIGGGRSLNVIDFARKAAGPNLGAARNAAADRMLAASPADLNVAAAKSVHEASEKKDAYDRAREALRRRDQDGVQVGKLGVDLSVQTNNLRNQARLEQTAQRNVLGRNCLEVGGVWIDDGFNASQPAVTVKAQSQAYFRMLERQPQLKEVFALANQVVWVAPSGTALIVDANDGREKLSDAEIDGLFVAKK